jgi:DNA-binding NtrC family response regulator
MKHSILVVDDQEASGLLLQSSLTAHGYAVPTAGDAAEAMAAIGETAPDIVLLEEGRLLELGHLQLGEDARGRNETIERIDAALNRTWPPDGIDSEALLGELERRLIRRALDAAGGNRSQAARLLGIKRDKLRYRLRPPEREECR